MAVILVRVLLSYVIFTWLWFIILTLGNGIKVQNKLLLILLSPLLVWFKNGRKQLAKLFVKE